MRVDLANRAGGRDSRRDPAETPYAVYELELWPSRHLQLPATGSLQCAVSPEGAFSILRSHSSIDVEGATYEGWSMLRLIHETGAKTLYRFSHTIPDTEDFECGEDCHELQVGEQMGYPHHGVSHYSEGAPGVIEIHVASRFVFVGMRPGVTSLVLIMHNGDQKTLRFRVTNPSEPPTRARSQTQTEFQSECESGDDCPTGECVEGLCANWRSVDCFVR